MEQGRKAQGLEQDWAKEPVRPIHWRPRSARMSRGHEVACVAGIAAAIVAEAKARVKVFPTGADRIRRLRVDRG